MPEQHWKGVPLPRAGDDLLGAWRGFADAIGVVVPAASIAAAREKLANAEAAGHPVNAANPAFFLIHGITYASTGKGGNGVWDLVPTTGREVYWAGLPKRVKTYMQSGQYAWQDKFTQAGTKPYDRICKATATMWANTWHGVDLVVWINGSETYAAFPTGWEGDQSTGSSQTVTAWKRIPAGVAPDIWVGLRGRRPTSWAQTDSDSAWSNLIVEFDPAGMY